MEFVEHDIAELPARVPLDQSSIPRPLFTGRGGGGSCSPVARWSTRPPSQSDTLIPSSTPTRTPEGIGSRLANLRQHLFGRSTTAVGRQQRVSDREQTSRACAGVTARDLSGVAGDPQFPVFRASSDTLVAGEAPGSDRESKENAGKGEGEKEEVASFSSRLSLPTLSWRTYGLRANGCRDPSRLGKAEEGRTFLPFGESASAASTSDEDEFSQEGIPLACCSANAVFSRQESEGSLCTPEGGKELLRRLLSGCPTAGIAGNAGESLEASRLASGNHSPFYSMSDDAILRPVIDGPVRRVVALAVTVYGKTRDFLSEADPLFFEIGIEPPLQVRVKHTEQESAGHGAWLPTTILAERSSVDNRRASAQRLGGCFWRILTVCLTLREYVCYSPPLCCWPYVVGTASHENA